MTPEEAMKVAALALDVDGRCGNCSGALLDALARVFPERAGVWREASEANDGYIATRDNTIDRYQRRAGAGRGLQ